MSASDRLAWASVVALWTALAVALWAPWTGPVAATVVALGLPGVAGLWASGMLSGEGVA